MTWNVVSYFKMVTLINWQNSLETSSWFFENQPKESCSLEWIEGVKGQFFEPEKLQNHTNVTNEGKGKEKKKESRGRKGEKLKKQRLLF